jgi:hypothetical protein
LTASKYTSKEAAIEDLRNMSAAFKRLVKTSELQGRMPPGCQPAGCHPAAP